MRGFSEGYFFTEKESIIKVGSHDYIGKNGKNALNAHIGIDDSSFNLSISMPLHSLEKLLTAGKKFLETRRPILFYGDEIRVEKQEDVQAKEA